MDLEILTKDQWWDSMLQVAAFHDESQLPFVWLPTPLFWDTLLEAQKSPLRAKEMPPRSSLPPGLFWYAWAPSEVIEMDKEQQQVWYDAWKKGQLTGRPPLVPQVGSPDRQ